MRFLGNVFLVSILVAGMGASYHFLYRPKSDCASHVHALQQRIRVLPRAKMQALLAASGTNQPMPLEHLRNFLDADPLPTCPDSGQYTVTFRATHDNARSAETHFHVNCTEHRFRTGL